MTVDLTGQVVVITGAARGLGAAYAVECARRGAALLLTDIAEAPLATVADRINRDGGVARVMPGDITTPGFADELAADCARRWGAVTGWVNNAGLERLGGVDSIDPTAAWDMVRVNLLGTIFGTGAAARAMIPHGMGSILNVTSGAQHGMPQLAAYGATKGGVASLTYAAAMELSEHGVRVNAISPLATTRMTEDLDRHFSALTGNAVTTSDTLRGPDRIAPVVAYLLSPEATGISGQVVRFDGRFLNIVRHPEVDTTSAVARDEWAAEDVAAAFDDSLRAHLYSSRFSTPVLPPQPE